MLISMSLLMVENVNTFCTTNEYRPADHTCRMQTWPLCGEHDMHRFRSCHSDDKSTSNKISSDHKPYLYLFYNARIQINAKNGL